MTPSSRDELARDALSAMGFPLQGASLSLLQDKDGVIVFRVTLGAESYILKCFLNLEDRREIDNYRLLITWGVPTLRLSGQTDSALLMEDLQKPHTAYRLATKDDVLDTAVGRALGEWYRSLHGRSTGRLALDGLYRETDALGEAAVRRLMERSGTQMSPLWPRLLENLPRVKAAVDALPHVATYNDFHWTNLAVVRQAQGPLARLNPFKRQATRKIRALMFDYNLLGRGYRYADLRNVQGGLSRAAFSAFMTAYDAAVDPFEVTLDDVVAPLYSLIKAYERPALPDWAQKEVDMLHNGELLVRVEGLLHAL